MKSVIPVRNEVREGQRGFALLVIFLMAAAVAITLYVEIPRVAFESQRNREELLIARGEQYKRAIELYFRKTKKYPQEIKELENTNNFRFLRRRYIDPLTGKDEWRLVHMGPAGLTDSLVEKMPGLDADKKNANGTQTASNGMNGGGMNGLMGGGSNFGTPMGAAATTTPATAVDPNAPKGPDDVVVGSNRTERDQRALMAQRGQTAPPLQPGDPGYDPYAARILEEQQQKQGNNPDPNAQFQQQLLADYQKQQQLIQQQQQQQGNGSNGGANLQLPVNPNAPPPAPGTNPQTPGTNVDQFQQQQQNAFPAIGSPNGPVRTIFPTGNRPPFNPGNAMVNPNPGAAPTQPAKGTIPNAFSVPQAVRDQLTRPGGPVQATANQTFGGGGIAGVASTAAGTGIKRYAEKGKYKEWEFVYDYRKPAKGAKKGVTGVGGLNTNNGSNGQQQPGSSLFGNSGVNTGGTSGGFGSQTKP